MAKKRKDRQRSTLLQQAGQREKPNILPKNRREHASHQRSNRLQGTTRRIKVAIINLLENKPVVLPRGITYSSAAKEKALLKKHVIIDLIKIPAAHGQEEISKVKAVTYWTRN